MRIAWTSVFLLVTALALSVGCSDEKKPETPEKLSRFVAADATTPEPEKPTTPGHKGVYARLDEDVAVDTDGPSPEEEAEDLEELARHQPRMHRITVRPEETLQLYSDWSGVSAQDLKLQNAGKRPIYGKSYVIPLSVAELENFQQRRENYWRQKTEDLYKGYKVIPVKYQVKKNDTLLGIAKKHNTPLWFVVRLNENLDPYHLSVGQKLMVPNLEEKSGDEVAADGATHVGDGDTASVFEVIVRPGETASRYAKWGGIEVEDIEKSNRHLKDINRLRVGDRIKLPFTAKQQKEFMKKRDRKKKKKRKGS